MAKWTLPEGKIYTQADLDAAVAAALREAATLCAHVSTADLEATNSMYEEGYSDGAAVCHCEILALITEDAQAALDRYVKERSDKAMAAERERCAKVAETYEQWATDFGPLNPEDVAEHIAAAIRAQGET